MLLNVVRQLGEAGEVAVIVEPVFASPEAALENLKSREDRYKLGQFFTPGPIAEHMASAVLEIAPATVLDPGVGGGILLRARWRSSRCSNPYTYRKRFCGCG